MMRSGYVTAAAALAISVSATPASAVLFGEILTFDPLSDPVNATFNVDMNNTQTWSGLHLKDIADNPQPQIHWFKYVADGNSAVTFDTYGTDISSDGPNPDRSPGNFLNAGNATQIAVYDAAGALVAATGGVKDLNGELVPEFPDAAFDDTHPNYHLRNSSVQLSELMFMANAPGNPHWDTSPGAISDPLSPVEYEGLHIDCFECNGQTYSQGWNEYEVWTNTLQGVIDGTLANWRASDHYNVGPGARWNRYNALAAGDYYIAVTGSGPSFSGDVRKEEYLQAPIHAGWDRSDPFNPIFLDDVAILDNPMGPFEMYLGEANPVFQSAWGDIQLNVTHFALALEGDLDGDGFVGINDLNIVLGNWNQNVPPADPLADPSGDGFVGIDDLNAVLGNWNAGTPPTSNAAIPEPTSLALLGLGGLATIRRRR